MKKSLFVLLLAALGVMGNETQFFAAPGQDDYGRPLLAQVTPPVQEQTAEGQLLRVDAQQKLLWIKMIDGKEMQFSYNEQTQVEGTQDGVEGLARMSGRNLTVQYQSVGGTNTAVKIILEPALG